MTTPRTILLLHGFASTRESYFLPSLRERYRAHEVYSPSLPSPMEPDIDAWTQGIIDLHVPTHVDLIVAHSLGGTLAWSLLTRGIITASTLVTIGSSPGPKENVHMNSFLRYPLDFTEIKKNCTKHVIVHSLDDPWTMPEYALVTIKHTNGTGLIFADKGHFEMDTLPLEVIDVLDASIES